MEMPGEAAGRLGWRYLEREVIAQHKDRVASVISGNAFENSSLTRQGGFSNLYCGGIGRQQAATKLNI